MKRILSALLILLLCLPLPASASRTRITSYTEAEWQLVSDTLDALAERADAAGTEALSPDERLLYIALEYNGLMLSGGLVSVMLYMEPELIADIPAALRSVGAEDHALQFEAFMAESGCNPGRLQMLAFLGESFIRTLHPFDEFDAAFFALDEQTALTTLLCLHIAP